MLTIQLNMFFGCQHNKSNPAYTFYQCSVLSHSGEIQSVWAWCIARWVTSDSLSVSVSSIQEQCIYQCCNGCSLCLDVLISILLLDLLAFSALVSAFQHFAHKHRLQFLGLSMCSVTLTWNEFLIKKIVASFTCHFCGDCSNKDTCKFESLPSEGSKVSDGANSKFWRCQIFWL